MKGLNITVNIVGAIVRLIILGVCLFLLVNLGKKAYDFGFRIFAEGPMAEAPGRDILVSVNPDEGLKDVAQKLEEKGLTSDWMLFFVQAKLSEFKGEIAPGAYTLNTSMTTDNMMQILTKSLTLEGEDSGSGNETSDELETLPSDENAAAGEVEAGSELVEGDMEDGEVSYLGEGADDETEDDDTVEIDIEVGE